MLYQINNGAVAFADDVILHNVFFEIRNTEKIAVVGRNGCGKTTLLKLIAGEVELEKRDSDEDVFIASAGNPQIGYLKQIAFEDPSFHFAGAGDTKSICANGTQKSRTGSGGKEAGNGLFR